MLRNLQIYKDLLQAQIQLLWLMFEDLKVIRFFKAVNFLCVCNSPFVNSFRNWRDRKKEEILPLLRPFFMTWEKLARGSCRENGQKIGDSQNRQMWGPDHFWIAPPGEQKGQRLQAVHQVDSANPASSTQGFEVKLKNLLQMPTRTPKAKQQQQRSLPVQSSCTRWRLGHKRVMGLFWVI